jgi:ADP-ribose pyrophosphatase YjhB (NUDIX family)
MKTSQNIIEIIVRVIFKKYNKILLCKSNEHGHYFLPGGHVEFGDTLETTVYKEMNEELGLEKEDIQNVQFVKFFENTYGPETNKFQEINFVFEAKMRSDIEIESKEEHISFEWIDENKLAEVNVLPKGIL